jgi:nitroimidazol reductase NimA-like FMN-containing flavoprotein (pyridoxamine 5'-phosphate oxidase superfamily)
MINLNAVRTSIEDIINNSRFAVLATEADGQPHASLVAVTPIEGFRKLIFATYRNTRKYNNIAQNSKVAVLVESIDVNRAGSYKGFVLTAFGHAEEIELPQNDMVFNAHMERHPELLDFLQSKECVLFRIKVDTYQVVRGIDDVEWWTIEDLYV